MSLHLPSSTTFDSPGEGEGEALRPLNWSALIARLGAERDLRRELANGLGTPRQAADFIDGAAQVATGLSHDAPSVNPDALADCKSTGGNTFVAGPHRPGTKLGARGQQ